MSSRLSSYLTIMPAEWFLIFLIWLGIHRRCGLTVASVTGGFCEELIFRGYLMRQFSAWTDSSALGIVLQGMLFGLGHAYYGGKLILQHGNDAYRE